MSPSNRFGDLRSLLQKNDPSPEVWAELCTVLDALTSEFNEIEAYCQSFLDTWPDTVPRKAPDAWLRRLALGEHEPRLSLCNSLFVAEDDKIDELILELARHGSHLRPLYFSAYPEVGVEAVAALARSPVLSNVRELYLYGIPSEGGFAIATSSFLCSLTRLELEGADFNSSVLRSLVESPHLPNLTELDLFDCGLRGHEIAALSRSPGASKLTWLNLSGDNGIGMDGARALAESPHLAGLKFLFVNSKYDGGVGQDGLRALIASPHLCSQVRESLETLLLRA